MSGLRRDWRDFSTAAQGVLERSGWHPERDIDVSQYIKILEEEGNFVSDVVIWFLRSFGGIRLINRHDVVFAHFRPDDAVIEIYSDSYIDVCRNKFKRNTCVVGSIIPESSTIMMDDSGGFYGVYAPNAGILGNTDIEMIERICATYS